MRLGGGLGRDWGGGREPGGRCNIGYTVYSVRSISVRVVIRASVVTIRGRRMQFGVAE